MQLWHWHPIFVHLTVALLSTGSVLFMIRALFRNKAWASDCLTAASWVFWIGIIMALFTSATGLLAYFTLPLLDESALIAIHKHFISAALTLVTYLGLAFFLWRRQRKHLPPSVMWTTSLVVAVALLACTGYLGGDLVFKRGIGVDIVTGIDPL